MKARLGTKLRWLVIGVLVSSSRGAAAQPWSQKGDVPLAPWVRSVRLHGKDPPFFQQPDASAPRRGAGVAETALPIFARRRGPGCEGRWLLVGALAWLCDRGMSYSGEPPSAAASQASSATGTLPLRYYFVGADGALGYRTLESADDSAPAKEFEHGFSVAVLSEASERGEDYVLTTEDLWLPRRDLTPAKPSAFRGVMLMGNLGVGWVWTERALVFASPNGQVTSARTRLERVDLLEATQRVGVKWWRIAERAWLRSSDVRAVVAAPKPPGLKPLERWLDVDIQQQVLTAYEGERPVFATLVSTGRGRDGSLEATPKGLHRIWVKIVATNMDNLEAEEARRYYSMQAVPWVMFFKDGFGLHGTYWHASFGRTRSHGCVNLSLADAEWLFTWTRPHLPALWSAVHPSAYELGTLVQVR